MAAPGPDRTDESERGTLERAAENAVYIQTLKKGTKLHLKSVGALMLAKLATHRQTRFQPSVC